MHSLSFDIQHRYDLSGAGITVPLQLHSGGKMVDIAAKLDTGADNCIFAREYGERLELDIESGTPQYFGTATGRFLTFGHEVTLNVLGFVTVSTVYFAENAYFSRNVLGRIGWLDRIALGLVDYEGTLYLKSLW